MSKRFWIIGGAVALLCAGLVAWNIVRGIMMASFFANAGRPPVAVEAVNVEPITWRPGIEAVGTTRAVSGADLSVQAAGVVRAINFAAGDQATTGEVLVQIDDSAEQADMAATEANIKLASSQLGRATALNKRGFTAGADLDTARAQLEVAQSTYARLKAVSDLKAIKAPFDGVVGIAQVNVGQFAPVGTVVVTLQDLDQLKVDFTVPEQMAADVRNGQPVHFGITPDSLPFSGSVIGIDPKVDPQTHLVNVQALLDNKEHKVLPGQFLRVRVELGAQPGVLALPQTAVITSLYGDYVCLVAKDAKDKQGSLSARQTFVVTGRRDSNFIEIKNGLKPGDQVINAGQNKLQNGAHVVVEPAAQASTAGGAL